MAVLRCPECLAESPVGTFYCGSCDAPLLPLEMMPAAEQRVPGNGMERAAPPDYGVDGGSTIGPDGEPRYRIVLGDACPVCRAASRITFTAGRLPVMPVVGCRDAAGCRCTLPSLDPPPAATVAGAGAAVSAPAPAGPLLYDAATGAFSREAFEAFATAVATEAMRRGLPLAVILLRLGGVSIYKLATQREQVEVALRRLAEHLRQTVRGGDLIGRHGPLTLALLAHGAEESGAFQLAKRIQAAVAESGLRDAGDAAYTIAQGIATLPASGRTVAEVLEQAEDAVSRALVEGGQAICVSERTPGPALRGGPAGQNATLVALTQAYERGEIEGVAIEVRPGACPACRHLAGEVYAPRSAPSLPLVGCTGHNGCRCSYGRPRLDPRRRPPPIPAIAQSLPDVPRRWLDAAFFGADPKRSCKAGDLAAYLDAFPLLPSTVEFDLHAGEAAYLQRSVRRGADPVNAANETVHGLRFPLDGSLADWVRQTPRPPRPASALIPFWDSGLLCLTNWRLIFRRRGAVESVLLADIAAVEYLQGGIACTIGSRGKRLLFLVPDALQVGLCVTRALRDVAALEAAGSAAAGRNRIQP